MIIIPSARIIAARIILASQPLPEFFALNAVERLIAPWMMAQIPTIRGRITPAVGPLNNISRIPRISRTTAVSYTHLLESGTAKLET